MSSDFALNNYIAPASCATMSLYLAGASKNSGVAAVVFPGGCAAFSQEAEQLFICNMADREILSHCKETAQVPTSRE